MKAKRTINYPDLDLPCPICGERFKTRQGLAGHKQFKHGSAAVIASKDHSPADPDGSVKELKDQVERLELEAKKRRLQAELPSTAREPPDLMQQLGLGPFDPEVKAQAQRRAMAMGVNQAPGWIEKLLSNPGGIKIAADALKGVLGVNRDNGDNSLKILSDLGFDLKTLISNSTAPKSGSFKVGDLDLAGASLTPELLTAILAYKAAETKAQAEYEGKKAMADSLDKLVKVITPEIISRFTGGRRGNGAADIISQEIMSGSELGEATFLCSKCGHENKLPENLIPGMEIHCQGKDSLGNDCTEVWHAVADQPKPQRQAKKRQIEVQEPPTSIPCEGCGQMLAIEGKPLGSELTCPICQRTQVLMSPDIPLDPGSPEEQSKFLHR